VVGMAILNAWPVLNQQKSVGAITQKLKHGDLTGDRV